MLTSRQIEPLLRPKAYPADVAAQIRATSPLAVQIANRWMLGWPTRVKTLLAAGSYLPALKEQETQEREVLANSQVTHLARHELMEEFGLSPAPPLA
ncbi:hypothetical protein N800_01655 [Lysobacter daejeonensis GH1-9]|uniref:Uncharacterized protein n=1 Tax=Lysobacter daejeonensis GH1-9 TaxID=1385517 RepID=A0A0A0EVQ4_9GAMM|nr:hypothetical protein N800_01655 [Lysobacter daejeonensis GH1-9]